MTEPWYSITMTHFSGDTRIVAAVPNLDLVAELLADTEWGRFEIERHFAGTPTDKPDIVQSP